MSTVAVPSRLKKLRGKIHYGAWSKPLGPRGDQFSEALEPGVFAASLRSRRPVNFLIDHAALDDRNIYGEWPDGALTIQDGPQALEFTLGVDPDDETGMSLYRRAQQRAFDGVSFAMRVERDIWLDDSRRIVTRAQLLDISCVKQPAYEQHSYEARNTLLGALGLSRIERRGQFVDDIDQRLAEAERLPAYLRGDVVEKARRDFWHHASHGLREDQLAEVRTIFAEFIPE